MADTSGHDQKRVYPKTPRQCREAIPQFKGRRERTTVRSRAKLSESRPYIPDHACGCGQRREDVQAGDRACGRSRKHEDEAHQSERCDNGHERLMPGLAVYAQGEDPMRVNDAPHLVPGFLCQDCPSDDLDSAGGGAGASADE